MISKDELQDRVLEHWKNNGGIGCINWVTGVGKSYELVKASNKRLEKYPDSVIHYIVPTRVLKRQAEKVLDSRVQVFVINTYVKQARECHLLLLDEIHRYAAVTFSKLFTIVKYVGKNHLPFRLGATASLERSDGRHSIIEKYCPVISNIDFKMALENKWICDFEVINIKVPKSSNYDDLSNAFRSDFAYFHDDMTIMFKCMSYPGAKEFIEDNGLDVDVGTVIGLAKRCRKAMQERNELIYEAEDKLKIAKELLDSNSDKKSMTFSMSINFASKLTDIVDNSVVIDSTMGEKKRNTLLTEFEEGKYKVLNSVKIFEEGYDAPDVDFSINISCTSIERQFIQRLGRVLRYKEGKKAIMYCLYIEGTKEYWTLKKAQARIPNVRWI